MAKKRPSDRQEQQARPLPGSRHPLRPVRHYVVNLKGGNVEPSPSPSRAAAVAAGTAVADAFVRKAHQAIADHQLTDEFGGFGEAYGLPVVTFTGTPAVAKLIESIDGVLSVYADDQSVGIIS